ncbi:hypothetical protein AKO1_002552 [Acrasis kona]|uniref:Uncharacterized protein n=1 Tax=Acrasis kona TaxID=1008807 RepID=A0AAW2ZLJ6_9EUKA
MNVIKIKEDEEFSTKEAFRINQEQLDTYKMDLNNCESELRVSKDEIMVLTDKMESAKQDYLRSANEQLVNDRNHTAELQEIINRLLAEVDHLRQEKIFLQNRESTVTQLSMSKKKSKFKKWMCI